MCHEDVVKCPQCNNKINVSDLAVDYAGCSWFSDGETIYECCNNCGKEVCLLINIKLCYEVKHEN